MTRTVELELPPDLEAIVDAKAAEEGLTKEQWLRLWIPAALRQLHQEGLFTVQHNPNAASLERLLHATQAMPPQPIPFYATATPEEWERAFLEWTESHSTDTPILPPEAFERESLYEDRD
jgi:hypothetical protein